jgi:hypothetical protein
MKDVRGAKRYGISKKFYRYLVGIGVLGRHGAYPTQVNNAIDRDIPWHLDLKTWLAIWIKSGHLENRGKGINKYVMARHGDQGPYSEENVSIITGSANVKEFLNRRYGKVA